MKEPKPGQTYFFVDESGDATFYDKEGNLIVGQPGCSPILLLGFIETQDPQSLRKSIISLHKQVLSDPYFQEFPSLTKTATAFHAKDDVPEIRYQVFKLIATLEFKAQFVVARKIEKVFRNNFSANRNQFYDHLVARLFENMLHRYERNHIYFSKRGSGTGRYPSPMRSRMG